MYRAEARGAAAVRGGIVKGWELETCLPFAFWRKLWRESLGSSSLLVMLSI